MAGLKVRRLTGAVYPAESETRNDIDLIVFGTTLNDNAGVDANPSNNWERAGECSYKEIKKMPTRSVPLERHHTFIERQLKNIRPVRVEQQNQNHLL